MSPEARRIVIPIIVISIALVIMLVIAFSPRRGVDPSRTTEPSEPVATERDRNDAEPERAPTRDPEIGEVPTDRDETPEVPETVRRDEDEPDAPAWVAPERVEGHVSLEGLRAVPPIEHGDGFVATPLGSLNPREADVLLEFSTDGAGIRRITLSNVWQTAAARLQAEAHYAAREAADPSPPPLPDESLRYVIKEQMHHGTTAIPVLATHNLRVVDLDANDENGHLVDLWHWSEIAPGKFETIVVNNDDQPVLRLTREFVLGPHGDMTTRQRVHNLTDRRLGVSWRQYGPSDLEVERARYFDPRRFRFGYLWTGRYPQSTTVLSEDNKLVLERRQVIKEVAGDLWPTSRTIDRGYSLTWFASVSRYFTIAVHPVLDDPARDPRTIEHRIERISFTRAFDQVRGTDALFVFLIGPTRELAPASELDFDLGVYIGPMDRHVLSEVEPFKALGMNQLILFQMSTWCAFCTFQPLARFLLWFLTLLHDYVLFDWGLAIIGLVVVVRLLLHPITKRSQINMMRFGKQMQAMKPEIDKLQKKYKDEPKKMQQEQIRLMREYGVNPFQMLGCLPMFLQIPIWIALYAMLYYAYDIRHEPALFGVFQMFWGWTFLADLSSGDHFFGEFKDPITLFNFWHLTGLNILPIVMGLVMFVHQKYMTPPPTPNMTDEQIQQQRIMRVMMVIMLPVLLYNAPAGLTLYILTSSIIGIIESKYVRAHVDQLDLEPKKQPIATQKKKKKKKLRDPQARAYDEAVEARRKQRQEKQAKTFKKRK
jgi:YidC/Oxa1 family membrane protein insertase